MVKIMTQQREPRIELHDKVTEGFVRRRGAVILRDRKRLFSKLIPSIKALEERRKEEPDRTDLPKMQDAIQSILSCGQIRSNGKSFFCKKPIFCERCMNLKKAQLGSAILHWVDKYGPMYGWVETVRYAFPRGVIVRNGVTEVLMDFEQRWDLSPELSNNGVYIDSDYSNAFYQTLEAMEHYKDSLQECRVGLYKELRRSKDYLGAISMVHYFPYSCKGIYVELKTLILKSQEPLGHKSETSKCKMHHNDFSYTTRYNGKSDLFVFNQSTTLKNLDKVFKCEAGALGRLNPQELRNYIAIFQKAHTFMAVGPLFYGKNRVIGKIK